MKGRGGKGGGFKSSSKPIGVTKSMLAARNELQTYGVKNSLDGAVGGASPKRQS